MISTVCLFFLLAGCAVSGVSKTPDQSRALAALDPAIEMRAARGRPQDPAADMVAIKDTIKAALQAYSENRLADAQAHYLLAEQLGANDETIMYWLGNYALIGGDLSAAQKYYESVLRINPANAKALYNLAVVYLSRAEDHFHYYTATVPDQDVERKLLELLASIDQFSDHGDAAVASESPLDSLRQLLEN